MLSQRRELTWVQLSFPTLQQRCDNVNNDVVTTLSQRQFASWVKIKRNTLLLIRFCQVENIKSITLFNSIANALG